MHQLASMSFYFLEFTLPPLSLGRGDGGEASFANRDSTHIYKKHSGGKIVQAAKESIPSGFSILVRLHFYCRFFNKLIVESGTYTHPL